MSVPYALLFAIVTCLFCLLGWSDWIRHFREASTFSAWWYHKVVLCVSVRRLRLQDDGISAPESQVRFLWILLLMNNDCKHNTHKKKKEVLHFFLPHQTLLLISTAGQDSGVLSCFCILYAWYLLWPGTYEGLSIWKTISKIVSEGTWHVSCQNWILASAT